MKPAENHLINLMEKVNYKSFKLINDLKRIVRFNKKFKIPEIETFLSDLNTAMFDYMYPNYLNPLFTAFPKFSRYCMAIYVMYLKERYFENSLEICSEVIEYNYKYNSILVGGACTVEQIKSSMQLFDEGKLILGRLRNSIDDLCRFLRETKNGRFDHFDLFNQKVIDSFTEARRDKLGNPREGSSWNQLVLFLFKAKTVQNANLINSIRMAFQAGNLSFLEDLTVSKMVDVAVAEIQRNPMFYLNYYKKQAAEDESHMGEPGDWYLWPHPTIWIRDKILSEFADLEDENY